MISGTLKLALGALVAALFLSSLFAGPNGGDAVSFLRTLLSPSVSAPHVQTKLASAPLPQASQGFGDQVVLKPGAYGNFYVDAEIGGERLHMLIDTGASLVLLSHREASALGYRPFPSDYKYQIWTANGASVYARILIPEIRVGPLSVRAVEAAVAKRGALTGHGLLGMSFLKKLRGYEVNDGLLILKN